jgi:hypothetical protein
VKLDDSFPWATALTCALVLIVVIVGGVVTITNGNSLSFRDYIAAVTALAFGTGLLGVGRGIKALRQPPPPPPPAP